MKHAEWRTYEFAPEDHLDDLRGIVREIESLSSPSQRDIDRVLRRYPKNGSSIFSRSEIIAGFRHLSALHAWPAQRDAFIEKLRMKPVRTLSGVTPVTILTKPFPCPGKCVFCPSDVRMPKSYLTREPGAQRAAIHQFDPYDQTLSRLSALYKIGHPVDKIELIVLGGTWSSYPEEYQIWFLKRSFDAMNDFGSGLRELRASGRPRIDFEQMTETVDGRRGGNPYNRIVSDFLKQTDPKSEVAASEQASWEDLELAQKVNETSGARSVGLSLETRPDHVTVEEIVRLRRLGATKIQIGYQSLSDEILKLNQRGHDVAASRRATQLLRRAGFKIQAHWMPNLYGATPASDVEDFSRLFDDPDFRPDELKLYPCSLIETAELMVHYDAGRYRPYGEDELLELLIACLQKAPVYCRLTRVIRDIPGDDILAGSRVTNFRAVAEAELEKRGLVCRDIRKREIRGEAPPIDSLALDVVRYQTSAGEEAFCQFVTEDERIAGFVRLCLPKEDAFIAELEGCAIVRELHVYGMAVGIGDRLAGTAQHAGLGRRLLDVAAELARERGYRTLAVISSVGTRQYYRRQGFRDGPLYQHRALHDG